MNNQRILAPFAILLSCGTLSTSGDCLPDSPHLVEVQIDSCVSNVAFAEARSECVDLEWLERMQARAVDRSEGAVVTGRIVSSQEVTWFGRESVGIGPAIPIEQSGVWYVSVRAQENKLAGCDSLSPGSYQFLLRQPCCDVFPPQDLACWFEINVLNDVPEIIHQKLERYGHSNE